MRPRFLLALALVVAPAAASALTSAAGARRATYKEGHGAAHATRRGATSAATHGATTVAAHVVTNASTRRARRGMANIPSGSYRPLYAMPGMPGMPATSREHVAAFRLDREPVTRADFLRFVLANPAWRRDRIRPELAEDAYLAEWPNATNAGSAVDLERPVTSVSRLAASAYCESEGKRLPSVNEWEYVASADETRRDATNDPSFRARVLAMNGARTITAPIVGRQAPNVYGVRDLHGVVWEWTSSPDDHPNASRAHEPVRHVGCAGDAVGATDPSDYAAFARNAVRAGLGARSTLRSVGFRCAADLPG